MHVQRVMLPGSVTIIVIKPLRRILVDFSLSRDGAVLAIQGVMPYVHPDVVDHWLDNAFPRPSTPFKLITRVGTAAIASMTIVSVPLIAHAAHPISRTVNPAPYADTKVVLPSSAEGMLVAPAAPLVESDLEVVAHLVVSGVEAMVLPGVDAREQREIPNGLNSAAAEHVHGAKAHGNPWWAMGERPVQAFGKADRGGMNRHSPVKV